MAIEIIDTLSQKNNGEFPLIDSNDIKGGYYQVDTIDERDAIPLVRRKEGMLCYVRNDKMYTLSGGTENVNWLEFKVGTDGVEDIYYAGNTPPTNLKILWIDTEDEGVNVEDGGILDEISTVLQEHGVKIRELNSRVDELPNDKIQIEDTLTSPSADRALSAKQGRVLNERINVLNENSHTHSNVAILHLVTAEKVDEWNNKSDKHKHPYKSDSWSPSWEEIQNQPFIATKTSELTNDSGFITRADVGIVEMHTHSNMEELENLTALKMAEWDSKSDFDGDYNKLSNKPVIPTVDVDKKYVDSELGKKLNEEGHVLTDNNFTTIEKNKLNSVEQGANNYSLPIASPSVLGGVRVGSGLNINGGVLNVTPVDTHEHGNIEKLNALSLKFWTGTQVEFDAIVTKDSSTLYFIKE